MSERASTEWHENNHITRWQKEKTKSMPCSLSADAVIWNKVLDKFVECLHDIQCSDLPFPAATGSCYGTTVGSTDRHTVADIKTGQYDAIEILEDYIVYIHLL